MTKFYAMGRVWEVESPKKEAHPIIFMCGKDNVIRPALKPLKDVSLLKEAPISIDMQGKPWITRGSL